MEIAPAGASPYLFSMQNGIWPTDNYDSEKSTPSRHYFKSDRCGRPYILSASAAAGIEHFKLDRSMQLTEFIWRSFPITSVPFIDSDVLLRSQELSPPSYAERLARARRYLLSELSLSFFRKIGFEEDSNNALGSGLMGATYSSDPRSNRSYVEQLINEGSIEPDKHTYRGALNVKPTLAGLLQTERNDAEKSQAFVAMWFSKEMDEAWSEGMEPALRQCGYTPMRIDGKEHNNKIDDEIVAEIRRSSVLVADFTSERDKPRGGVYYEAGFAQGLGIPVIWTCHQELIDQVHFDTRQYNHITWETPAELKNKLINRIDATIGRGPIPAQ